MENIRIITNTEKKYDKDHFDELLYRIKEIRASERRIYKQITDIYKICSDDYNSDAEITRNFYATVQNKFHLAITGKTAAEILRERADSKKMNMGLTTWKNSPTGNIIQEDVKTAKNYYTPEEIDELYGVVNMYFDYAERQAKLHRIMKMEDWVKKLDEFLEFNDYDTLHNPYRVSAESGKVHAILEYNKYKCS